MNLGVVQFVVTSRPAIESTTLGIRAASRSSTGSCVGLQVTRRRDRRDRRRVYTPAIPRTAQRIVNTTVQAFQSLNVQWARERSRRRREFLAEQLAQTDSMLARAQAELSQFPEPPAARQLARQARRRAGGPSSQLETREAELDADRRTFRRC